MDFQTFTHLNLDEYQTMIKLTNQNHIASVMALSYEETQEFMILNVKYPHIQGSSVEAGN